MSKSKLINNKRPLFNDLSNRSTFLGHPVNRKTYNFSNPKGYEKVTFSLKGPTRSKISYLKQQISWGESSFFKTLGTTEASRIF